MAPDRRVAGVVCKTMDNIKTIRTESPKCFYYIFRNRLKPSIGVERFQRLIGPDPPQIGGLLLKLGQSKIFQYVQRVPIFLEDLPPYCFVQLLLRLCPLCGRSVFHKNSHDQPFVSERISMRG